MLYEISKLILVSILIGNPPHIALKLFELWREKFKTSKRSFVTQIFEEAFYILTEF